MALFNLRYTDGRASSGSQSRGTSGGSAGSSASARSAVRAAIREEALHQKTTELQKILDPLMHSIPSIPVAIVETRLPAAQ